MTRNSHTGYYLAEEDLKQLERIVNQLADFLSITHEQSIEELNQSIRATHQELEMEIEEEINERSKI